MDSYHLQCDGTHHSIPDETISAKLGNSTSEQATVIEDSSHSVVVKYRVGKKQPEGQHQQKRMAFFPAIFLCRPTRRLREDSPAMAHCCGPTRRPHLEGDDSSDMYTMTWAELMTQPIFRFRKA